MMSSRSLTERPKLLLGGSRRWVHSRRSGTAFRSLRRVRGHILGARRRGGRGLLSVRAFLGRRWPVEVGAEGCLSIRWRRGGGFSDMPADG